MLNTPCIYGTISNTGTAIFSDGTANKIAKLEIKFPLAQPGSGDPSLNNQRPIKKYVSNTVYVAADSPSDPGRISYTIDIDTNLPVLCAGTLDHISGILTYTEHYIKNPSVYQVSTVSGLHIWRISIPKSESTTQENITKFKSNILKAAVDGEGYVSGTFYVHTEGGSSQLVIIPPAEAQSITSYIQATAWLKNNGFEAVVPLVNPYTYQLVNYNQIETFNGNNYIFTTYGTIKTLVYVKSIPVSVADYNSAILNGNQTHARLVFPVQNITLNDDDISANGGIELTDILNSDTDITIGKAVSKELTVHLLSSSKLNGFDWTEEFRLDIGVEINGSTNWITIGYFNGSKPERTVLTETIEFVAYDRMRKFDVLANYDLIFTNNEIVVRVIDIYQKLCDYVGVPIDVGDWIPDVMNYSFTIKNLDSGITCRQALAYIAEANGCYAKITSEGKVKLEWFSDQTSSYSVDADDYFALDIGEIDIPVINGVLIDCTYQQYFTKTLYPSNATGIIYPIIDNPFLMILNDEKRTAVLTEIFARFTALGTYRPATVNIVGNWMVETGDIIDVGYGNGLTTDMPIFTRKLSWNGGCIDYYECTGEMNREEMTNSVKDQYNIGGKLSSYYKIVDGVSFNENGITVSNGKTISAYKFAGGCITNSLDDLSTGIALSAKAGNDLKNMILTPFPTFEQIDSPVNWNGSYVTTGSCTASMYSAGCLCILQLVIYIKSAISSTTSVGSIADSDYYPMENMFSVATQYATSNQKQAACTLSSAGAITFYSASASTSNATRYRITFVYFRNQPEE